MKLLLTFIVFLGFHNPAHTFEPKDIQRPTPEQKLEYRLKYIIKDQTKSEPGLNDRVESLFPEWRIVKNIKELNQKNIFQAKVDTLPWSDDYWPIYKGILGARYSDEEFDRISAWDEAHQYILRKDAQSIFQRQNSETINNLSPSEKYDLLFSDKKQVLTKNMWERGKRYFERSNDGYIETWMGICHGWAPASIMIPRPKKAIEVMSFNGKQKITFYPSDIKALASLLWANAEFEKNFIGTRCRQRGPEGRNCHDSNPATFHLALLNSVGLHQKSFIIDARYDYEVWNQPLISYSFEYFPPQKRDTTDTFEKSLLKLTDYPDDPYKKHRSQKAAYIVGVKMKITYGVESDPVQRQTDTPEYDVSNNAFYQYDLELDKDFKIVGGEWYSRNHPDFLWRPQMNAQALSSSDYVLLNETKWDGKTPLRKEISELASEASRTGEPLAYIVNSLIALAQ
ncbi:MAG: hypothetical protein CME62_14565 [Halobacteriovoraceae bacterium]|nr:hypothetical protein [Halobacteriovoraceae bacterium]|tara:strand:+ start:16272 stop:17633 length:1362 start_codon:yes stop_codon:yes gene_type:complete